VRRKLSDLAPKRVKSADPALIKGGPAGASKDQKEMSVREVYRLTLSPNVFSPQSIDEFRPPGPPL
jgi:hypothetical protein